MIEIQNNDTGIQFIIQVLDQCTNQPINISAMVSSSFIFRRPDKYTYSVTASLYTNGSDGKLAYTTGPSDLVMEGIWKVQATYILSGYTKYTSWITFRVLSNLTDLGV